jgi:hypothetical protein
MFKRSQNTKSVKPKKLKLAPFFERNGDVKKMANMAFLGQFQRVEQILFGRTDWFNDG